MKNLSVARLLVLAVIIGSAYFFILFSGNEKSTSPVKITKGIKWENIKKVVLEKEGKTLEIVSNDDKWVLPSKSDFKASTAAIRAFLLKLMDFSNAQEMKVSKEGIEKLGLNESGKKSGHGVVSLSYGKDDEPIKIFLGALRSRKGESMENELKLSGQYIKYSVSDQIFMIPMAINLDLDETKWLETSLISVPSSEIFSIESFVLNKNGSKTSEYVVSKADDIFSVNPKFEVSLKLPEGKVLQNASITQMISALESLTFEDVSKKESEQVKGIEFAKLVKFNLFSGKVYLISLAKVEDRHLIKIQVEYDPSLVEKIKLLKKENETKKNPDEKNSEVDMVKLEFTDVETVRKEADVFSEWIYEVPEYSYSRFAKNAADFFSDKNSVESKE